MQSHVIDIVRKALAVLDATDRRRIRRMLGLSVVLALLEVAGIGSIAPFVGAVANGGDMSRAPWLAQLHSLAGEPDERSFLLLLGASVMLLMTARNLFVVLSSWLVARYASLCRRNLSARLLETYLAQPFSYYLTRNTNTLRQNVGHECAQIVDGVLLPAVRAASGICVSAAILVLLVAADPVTAFSAAVALALAYAVTYWLSGRRLEALGREAHACRQLTFRLLSEAFGGIKDLKLLGREHEFVAGYRRLSNRLIAFEVRRNAIGLVPRHAIETLAIVGVVLIILRQVNAGADAQQLFPLLALYLLAGYRLLPALQQIYSNLSQLRLNRASLQTVFEDLAPGPAPLLVEAPAATTPLAFERAIRVKDVHFAYPSAQSEALNDINLEIERNISVAFVGSTGAGKTTLVDLIMGLLAPSSGSLLIDDIPLSAANARAWQRNIGYVPQHIWLSDESIARNIAFGVPAERVDMVAVRRAAMTASLHDFIANELPQGYDTIIGERGIRLSGGQRQRVGIARALYHDPTLLVFDEATSALDGATERAIIEAIDNLAHRISIILVAHRLNTVRNCDRVYVLEHGRIVATGTHAQLLQSSEAFQRLAS